MKTRVKLPDKRGYFGSYGGRFVPETLMGALEELERAYLELKERADFQEELNYYLREYAGRPSPLYLAENLTRRLGGAKIYLKREDLNHTGAHKINNTIGQAILARRMGKGRIIAETGRASMGSPRPPPQRFSGWNVRYTWARRTCTVRRLTCSG